MAEPETSTIGNHVTPARAFSEGVTASEATRLGVDLRNLVHQLADCFNPVLDRLTCG
jgi:hypothetical protein